MGKKQEKSSEGLSVTKAEDFSEWYLELVQKAALADYAPIKGFMIIRPRAYYIWQCIQDYFNGVLAKKDVHNAYFPLLIPDSFFKKEGEHAEGFAPELAYVAGGDEGEEQFAIRPTSETIIYDSYAKWIRSWRDLPLRLNQWCNVVRWEVKQTKPFLRTREFLWQEGHCAFASEKEAEKNMHEIIQAYKTLVEDLLAIPVMLGKKSKMETFAGAQETQAIEALMPDGKALQMGTSHTLGEGFAKVFDLSYQGEDGEDHYAWTTSWGVSTRLIGAVVMMHGDDKGLVLPPKIAATKVAIVPIVFEKTKETVLKKASAVQKTLKKYGALLDDREGYSAGWKFSEHELHGVPLRIEIGPKDVEKKQVTIVRRDTGAKEFVPEKKVAARVGELLDEIQASLFDRAKELLEKHIDSAKNMTELQKKLGQGKIVKVYMVDDPDIEEALKDETGGATSRIIEEADKEGVCVQSGEKTNTIAYVAKGY